MFLLFPFNSLISATNPPELRHNQFYYFAAEVDGHEWMADGVLEEKAHLIAKDLRATLVGPVGHLRGHYLLEHPRDRHYSLHAKRYDSHNDIRWSSLQTPQQRLHKRTAYSIEQVAKYWQQLGINDPGAKNQWHLVRFYRQI